MDAKAQTNPKLADGATVPLPAVASAVDSKDVLFTTASMRLRLLLALGLLALATAGITAGIKDGRYHRERDGRGMDSKTGHWSNATGSEPEPIAVVPCAIDLGKLLASANVYIDIDPVLIKQQNGCCGDDVCSLGEDFASCPADCTDGVAGTFIWVEPAHDRHQQQHGGRRGAEDKHIDGRSGHDRGHDDGDSDDGDHPVDVRDDTNRESGRAAGKHRGRPGGARHLILGLISLVICGLLVLSIRHELRPIAADFRTFLCPTPPTGCCCSGRRLAATGPGSNLLKVQSLQGEVVALPIVPTSSSSSMV